MKQKKSRVLLVDDHALVLDGLRRTLTEGDSGLEVVGQARSGAEALEQVAQLRPDIVLLDYKLDDMDGPTVLTRLRKAGHQMPVVVLTMLLDVHYVLRVLQCGAQGFVTKRSDPECILEAVRTALAGGTYVSPPLDREVAERQKSAGRRDGTGKLSPREFELMGHISKGDSLLEAAHHMGVQSSTASTYRARIMTKLGFQRTSDIIRYAIEHGLDGESAPAPEADGDAAPEKRPKKKGKGADASR